MQSILVTALGVHVLAGVFWAGSSFVAARTKELDASRLFLPQLGAAALVFLSGGYLWRLLHQGSFGRTEQFLGLGMAAAGIALALQAAAFLILRKRSGGGHIPALHRPAAILLMVTVVSMAVARYV